ncbi:MAG: carboxypeptidase-like regulatory domain-containing protein, partial [Hymenobacter sp.]|nr:carboxypeptidase-like regulatory domain-containing protein [Hymenobacter sp.]
MTFFPTNQVLRCLGLLTVSVFSLAPLELRAQDSTPDRVVRNATAGGVTGTLLDQKTGQVLPFANIVLLRAHGDTSFVAGAQTGENGAFELAQVAAGDYVLRATVLGYQPLRRPVTLSGTTPVARLGALKLMPTATQLAGVTVQGERAA